MTFVFTEIVLNLLGFFNAFLSVYMYLFSYICTIFNTVHILHAMYLYA